MNKNIVLLILLLFISLVDFYAQESESSDESMTEEVFEENLDDLFEEPQENIVVEEPEVDHRAQYETEEKVKVKGKYSAKGIVGAGWAGWNFFNDINDGFDASAGIQSSVSVSFDARPTPYFRFFGSLSTTFDPYASLNEAGEDADTAVWTEPAIGQLYADYILLDTLYSRLGKFSIGWGQGQLYKPGNIMSDSSSSSFNARFSLPNLYGLSIVLLTNNSTYYRDFTYAGKVDFVFGETLLSPGIKYNEDDGLSTLLSFKQFLFKTDFLIDLTTNVNDSLLQSSYILTGFFHEWEDFRLYGEYQYSWLRSEEDKNDIEQDHVASVAGKWYKPFSAPFDLSFKVSQSFIDGSGQLTFGLTQKILPLMTLNIGLPIIYGSEDSKFVVNNADPSKRTIALAMSLKLAGSF